jgi:hypothetical protein
MHWMGPYLLAMVMQCSHEPCPEMTAWFPSREECDAFVIDYVKHPFPGARWEYFCGDCADYQQMYPMGNVDRRFMLLACGRTWA